MKAIILAAGIGSRLGNSNPKPLTILNRQVMYLSDYLGEDNIIVVVGYKKELIMESFPNLLYVYNNYLDTTNTSKSLLKALKKMKMKIFYSLMAMLFLIKNYMIFNIINTGNY